MSELSGGVAVVTGAGSGLGAAMARAFAAEGMRIVALDIDWDAARATADALAGEGAVTMAAAVVVADRGSLDAAARDVAATFGACNVVCANVGVQQFGALDALTDTDWQWLLSVNVLGNVNTVNAFLPLLRATPGRRHVVVTSSVAALLPSPRQGGYIVTKFAITGYAEVLRQELADDGIGVTIVFPSGMMTRHLESSRAARPAALGESTVRDEDLQVVSATSVPTMAEVTTAEDAIRFLVDDVLAGEPYVIAHGARDDELRVRHRGIESAYERMRQARNP